MRDRWEVCRETLRTSLAAVAIVDHIAIRIDTLARTACNPAASRLEAVVKRGRSVDWGRPSRIQCQEGSRCADDV